MSATALVWWATLVAFLVVLLLAGLQLVRAVRGLKRLQDRIGAYSELPLMTAIGQAQNDVRRLEQALVLVAPLLARATIALAVLRRGPFPPEVGAAFRRLRTEVAAFRAAAGR